MATPTMDPVPPHAVALWRRRGRFVALGAMMMVLGGVAVVAALATTMLTMVPGSFDAGRRRRAGRARPALPGERVGELRPPLLAGVDLILAGWTLARVGIVARALAPRGA